MTEAVLIRHYGGSDVLVFEAAVLGAPVPGEILIRQLVASVNFHDIFER